MKPKTIKIASITAAALIVAAAVLIIIIYLTGPRYYLILKDTDTGSEYASYPVEIGSRFSVEFIHSVNKSPVRDIYEVRGDGDIYVIETDYYAFGAGVQTELNPGEVLEYGDDGSMRVENINIRIPELIYVVGTVSDHVLSIDDSDISLRDLCGRNSSVSFSVMRRLC